MSKVLVLYYWSCAPIEAMAAAIAEGPRSRREGRYQTRCRACNRQGRARLTVQGRPACAGRETCHWQRSQLMP